MSISKHELLGAPKHANQHRLSRLTMEVHTDELRIMASAVESYTDELIAALEAAEKRIAELEASHAAMLQGAEPVSQPYTLPTQGSEVVNEAAWTLFNMLTEHGPLNGHQFNNLKDCFYEALKVAMRNTAAPQRELNESAGLACKCRSSEKQQVMQAGWVAVPVEPTENMIIAGFEAELREEFRDPEAWEAFEAMSGCEQAAHRAKWCWAAMIAAAPDFREFSTSSTENFRENAETSTKCPKCSGRGSYHCRMMLGTVECECTLPAGPQKETY